MALNPGTNYTIKLEFEDKTSGVLTDPGTLLVGA
jgi:hypothetical protein